MKKKLVILSFFTSLLFSNEEVSLLAEYNKKTQEINIINPKQKKDWSKKMKKLEKTLKKPKTYEDVVFNLTKIQKLVNGDKYKIRDIEGEEYIFKRVDVDSENLTMKAKISIEDNYEEQSKYKKYLKTIVKDKIMCRALTFYFIILKGNLTYQVDYLNNDNIIIHSDVYNQKKCNNIKDK
jgi:hypothetical protein